MRVENRKFEIKIPVKYLTGERTKPSTGINQIRSIRRSNGIVFDGLPGDFSDKIVHSEPTDCHPLPGPGVGELRGHNR